MQLSDSQFSILSAEAVYKICRPFFAATGINYFCYARFYKVGYTMSLVSNADWQKYYYATNLYQAENFSVTLGKKLWHPANNAPQAVIMSRDMFNIDNRFEVAVDYGRFVELCAFGGEKGEQKVLDLYFNNFEALVKFKFYFLAEAQYLLKEANQPNNRIPALTKIIAIPRARINLECIENPRRYYVGNGYLTQKEFACVNHLLQGKTSVETAEILNMSEKTVRSHIDAVRFKLDISTKFELFDKLNKAFGIFNHY